MKKTMDEIESNVSRVVSKELNYMCLNGCDADKLYNYIKPIIIDTIEHSKIPLDGIYLLKSIIRDFRQLSDDNRNIYRDDDCWFWLSRRDEFNLRRMKGITTEDLIWIAGTFTPNRDDSTGLLLFEEDKFLIMTYGFESVIVYWALKRIVKEWK